MPITYIAFAAFMVAVLVFVLTFMRYRSKNRQRRCRQCGNSLYNKSFIREPVNGRPVEFCNSNCYADWKQKHAPKPMNEML